MSSHMQFLAVVTETSLIFDTLNSKTESALSSARSMGAAPPRVARRSSSSSVDVAPTPVARHSSSSSTVAPPQVARHASSPSAAVKPRVASSSSSNAARGSTAAAPEVSRATPMTVEARRLAKTSAGDLAPKRTGPVEFGEVEDDLRSKKYRVDQLLDLRAETMAAKELGLRWQDRGPPECKRRDLAGSGVQSWLATVGQQRRLAKRLVLRVLQGQVSRRGHEGVGREASATAVTGVPPDLISHVCQLCSWQCGELSSRVYT